MNIKMQVDDPPYLSVGTAVSAKYKGAFCEAKVSKVVRTVKCKVTYKMGLGTATIADDFVKGALRVGHTVLARHHEKKEFVEATIAKIQDCSQYTVVFDDGDITTLRRSALCLKSGRHFNESETLDQLPLTHPEHFGNPVVGGRRGRRNRQLKDDSSDGEAEEENEPDLEGYSNDIGRVVTIETTDKKRGKDNWFPGLVVIPSAQPTVRINMKDEYLVRSFKDGRYYTVPKKEVNEFSRSDGEKVESSVLTEAVNKVLKYLDNNELPAHWERNSLFNMQPVDSDSEENYSESSDDEPNEEKDRFVAQLYKFMDDSGTPLNKSPMVADKDVDLHKLFRVVQKLGGYNRATNQNKWRYVTSRLKLPINQTTFNQVKVVYKKFLLSYESFYKTLGVTMLNHNMSSTKKNRGRSLIRDKDRATPVNSPRPDKDEEIVEKKEDEKMERIKKKVDEKKRKEIVDISDTGSSDATDQSEPLPTTSKDIGRPRRLDKTKENRESRKNRSTPVQEKTKSNNDSFKKDEDDKSQQQTRSKSQIPKNKEALTVVGSQKKETKIDTPSKALVKPIVKKVEEEKKRGRKKSVPDEKIVTELPPDTVSEQVVNIGDKLKVFYGPEYKVTYEAKVIEIKKDSTGTLHYRVHYTGWNTRYDEWIMAIRIAENLSANTKAKRLKQSASSSGNPPTPLTKTLNKNVTKRGRGTSTTGRSTAESTARSTTPSSVTSSSSRTKSPGTPATRSASRTTRLDNNRRNRRFSAQTDLSNHSDSESEISESETEPTRTRSGGSKSDDRELKTYRRKTPKLSTPLTKQEKSKDSVEKEKDDNKSKRLKKLKKCLEKTEDDGDDEHEDDEDDDENDENDNDADEEDDNGSNPPKGRDFDLNQIRSELKGFNKAVKVPSLDTPEKDVLSSSDESNAPIKLENLEDKKELNSPEKSEDIYEFKEPEFEAPLKMAEDKATKKRIPRLYEELEKTPQKKTLQSPDKDSFESDKKRLKRTPKEDDSEDEEKKGEDPFDKLVESPSYNLKPVVVEKITENKPKVVRNIMDDHINIFRVLPGGDDYNRAIDLSDSESQSQPIFSRDNELFSDPFTKYSPDRTLDLEFSTKMDDFKKENEDMVLLRESINRVIERSNTSDEGDNLTDEDTELVVCSKSSISTYQGKKKEPEVLTKVEPPIEENLEEPKLETKEEPEQLNSSILNISPALQETDTSLLKSISAQPLAISKLDESKETINVKPVGTKIADSLLQKFSSLQNFTFVANKDKEEEKIFQNDHEADNVQTEDFSTTVIKQVELKIKPSDLDLKKIIPASTAKCDPATSDVKKRKKIVSKAYIDETDSDSSDSEQLVIARSDEDSQTNSMDKPDLKESDSNISVAQVASTDDSQSQEEPRNFKFDSMKKTYSPEPAKEESVECEIVKEEEPDSQLHSLLLCEETIPRSPAPASEAPPVLEQKLKPKSVLEMPFASAPGSSNNKSMLLSNEHKVANKQQPSIIVPLPNRENRVAATVLDNTPPTTPESSVSNLSLRGDPDDLSPNTIENESCKSNDAETDYAKKRRNSCKPSLYSEEDSQLTNQANPVKKLRQDLDPGVCRKRRKSSRTDEIRAKRGRKPLNRSRQNSDSDDTSEHSSTNIGPSSNVGLNTFDRTAKPSRPQKYNFYVDLDSSLDYPQRIAIIEGKMDDVRKTYADVKSELATLDRKLKKQKRREREALKASKQELVCG